MVERLFAIISPPCAVISTHKVASEAEVDKLFGLAANSQNYLYSAELVVDGKRTYAKQPWKLDPRHYRSEINTIPMAAVQPSPIKDNSDSNNSLKCPHCNKTMNSSSGLTLHIKSKHKGETS